MKTLIGGAIAFVVGIIGITIWHKDFLTVLTGIIPAMLIMGGGLALYLGFDELKDSMKKEDTATDSISSNDDVDKYKQEIDELKKEIDTLKSEKV
jgi:hypothetical protein